MQHCWPTTPSIVGCCKLHPFAHPVVCCCALFGVVAQSLKSVKLMSQQLPTFVPWLPKRCAVMLDLCARVFQHCWIHARALHTVSKVLWVVSFPGCNAGPNIVGSWCTPLLALTQQLPTLGIVGPTNFRVVASVCTQLYINISVFCRREFA